MERERDIERWLKGQVEDMGGLFWKFVSPGNDGVPDRILIMPGGGLVFVEIKTQTGELSPVQRLQISKLEKRRIPVIVIYGMEDAQNYIRILKKMTPVLKRKGGGQT